MNTRQIVLAAGALACMLSAQAFAQDSNWVDIKDPQELRALYSNKTFHVKLEGSRSVGWYRADGRGLSVQRNGCFLRTWNVKGQQVCLTDANGTSCFELRRNKADPSEIITRDVDTHAMMGFTVDDGAPDF